MTEEAIQEDVSTKNPRLELMESMAEKRRAEMGVEEIEEPVDEPIQEEDPDLEPEVIDEQKPNAPVYERDGVWYAKRKVNGEEQEVEYTKILADSQKNAAADQRLEEAARQRQELERLQRELDAKAAELDQAKAPASDNLDELLKKNQRAIADYDEYDPESVEALRVSNEELNNYYSAKQPKPQLIDKREVITEAVQEIKMDNWNRSLQEANKWLYEEQKDLDVEDQHLHELATNEAHRIMSERVAEGQAQNASFTRYDVDPSSVYRDAVSKTTEWLKARTGETATQARVERKREATGRSVIGNQAKATLKDNTPKVPTQAQRIADMRKARGLPT